MGELAKTLGRNIREERKKKGYSQDAFALAAGIDRSYIGRVERGEVNITVEKLYEISAVLECEPVSLLPIRTSVG